MINILVQLLTAFLGSLGFGLLFGLRSEHLIPASLGGMIAWGIYLSVYAMVPGIFLANLCASIFALVYAELLAHWRKSPATLFVIISIIPLVPGSSLYYTMEAAVIGDLTRARECGNQTLVAALAIAAGISLGTVFHELKTPKN